MRKIRTAAPSIPAPAGQVAPVAEPGKKMSISYEALASMRTPEGDLANPFKMPTAAPGVIPKSEKMALDSAIAGQYGYAQTESAYAEGLQFMGYAYLSELCQRAEYRRPSEILAKEMTRKWIKLTASGGEDKTEKINVIEAEMKRLGVQSAFRKAAEQDGYFGRSQIYLDMGVNSNDRTELMTPLTDQSTKIGRDSLKRLTVIEPIWTYPNQYNSNDPIDPTFFRPQSWFVMGKEIHSSRLLTFVNREVPDLLKPAYAFGGLSLSQLAKPYVDNWLRTRQSVSDLVHSFSVSGLKTNLSSVLNGGGGEELFKRAQLFNQARDNRGMMLVDKDSEDFFNVSTPLGTLDHLQAQSQEHMSAAVGIPLVKLLGITPSGLNASSEGEIQSYEDWVAAQQESFLSPHLTRLLNIIQLSKFGEIDPAIGFMWNEISDLDETEQATVRKTDADTACELIDRGVIAPQEFRKVLANQDDSPYAGIDLSEEITPPAGGEPPDDDLLTNTD